MKQSNANYGNTNNNMLQNTCLVQRFCKNQPHAENTIIHNRIHKSLEALWPISNNDEYYFQSNVNDDQTRERNFELDEDLTMFDALNVKNSLKHARSM